MTRWSEDQHRMNNIPSDAVEVEFVRLFGTVSEIVRRLPLIDRITNGG